MLVLVLKEVFFKIHRRFKTQSAVDPFWVIEGFDVVEDHEPGLLMSQRLMSEALGLECGKKRLDQRIVITVGLAAHAGLHLINGQ